MLKGKNYFSLTHAAHKTSAYRRLPYGWRTTPQNIPSDLYMFQQFLRQPGLTLYSSAQPTALHFPASLRQHINPSERETELARWSKNLRNYKGRELLLLMIADWLYRQNLNQNSSMLDQKAKHSRRIIKYEQSRDLWKARSEHLADRLENIANSKTWRYKNELSRLSGYSRLMEATKKKKR